jgi:cytoskeletal protein CcmA (bactofilin family)
MFTKKTNYDRGDVGVPSDTSPAVGSQGEGAPDMNRPATEAPVYPVHTGADTVLGDGTRFVGKAKVEGTLRIEGTVDGEIHTTETLVVGKTGNLKATVDTSRAVLNGTFKGKIEAKDRVEMQSGSHVEADVEASNMLMEEGVHFRGNCKIGK